MDLLIPFITVLAFAAAVEGVVEYLFGTPIDKYAPQFSWALMYVALVVSLAGVYTYKLDVFFAWFGLGNGWTWFGLVMTAAMISRGSNWINDFASKFLSTHAPQDDDAHG